MGPGRCGAVSSLPVIYKDPKLVFQVVASRPGDLTLSEFESALKCLAGQHTLNPMTETDNAFLPGVPSEIVLRRLDAAGGNEVKSGKLFSLESSAALAVNTFGWFIERPALLPAFPMLGSLNWPATQVEVEYCARFPWSGGKHPWLDACVETPSAILGVESKRFEPYRDRKDATFSKAYDRPVWHNHMAPFESLRDKLSSRMEHFVFLDAAQLVKHAFGLVTEGRRKAKIPYLVYLFAEPKERAGIPIRDESRQMHRAEIAHFAELVNGAEVHFGAISYREWLESWPDADLRLSSHRRAILERFAP